MRVELEPAVVLHRRAWRDTSFIIDLFTPNYGRVSAIARGARKAKARWRGLLEPLSQLEVSWSGRSSLKTLTQVEQISPCDLQGNALWGGFYASELIIRLTAQEDPNPVIYQSLAKMLVSLKEGVPALLVLRFFERDLLQALGYGLALTQESETGYPIEPELSYYWHPEHGLTLQRQVLDSIRVEGNVLLGLAHGKLTTKQQALAAKQLLTAALKLHLGAKPLKTIQMFRAMQQFQTTSV